MKNILLFSFFIISISGFAQVGINTTTPNAQLEIKSSNQATPSNTDGLLIPKIDAFPATNPTVLQQGMMVYLTTVSGANQPGFYSWDNVSVSWKPIASTSSNGWNLTGNAGTNPATNFIGTTDYVPLNFRVNNQNAGRIENDEFIANTFLGYQSGDINIGTRNSGFGFETLKLNSTGSRNTALGTYSLTSNTVGKSNTAGGFYALGSNTSGDNNCAFGVLALQGNTTGFLNTSVGSSSMIQNSTGAYNSAFGAFCLTSNTIGSNNTGIGLATLAYNDVGNFNTAIGVNALYANLSGSDNTATGFQSLLQNTVGYKNTATGYYALFTNTSGNNNTAMGDESLTFNTTSSNNTATGYGSLYLNTAADNTANGYLSLNFNTTGTSNVAMGFQSLLNNTFGNYNTAEGARSLYTNTTGCNNIALGYNAYPISGALTNYTGIGYNVGGGTSASNMVEIGNTSVSVIRGQVNFSTYSDARIKTNIKANVPGLSFISQLRPVTYNLDIHKQNEIMYQGKKEDAAFEGKYDIEKITQTGFIAQEIEAAAKKANYDFNGVNVPKNSQELYSISYSEFVVPLVKAVQELEEQNKELKSQNQQINKESQELEQNFLQLKTQNENLIKRLVRLEAKFNN
jgi:trimeric autotransporter adhesin